jgi:uncharacterized membrane protein YkoI
MLKQHFRFAVFITSLFLSFTQNAIADEQQGAVSPKQAIHIATENTPGDVIKTETSEHDGQAVYIIRIVNEGRVKDILVDSLSGEIIRPEKD